MNKENKCIHCNLDLNTIENVNKRGGHVRWCKDNKNVKGKILNINWNEVEKDIKSGLYTIKEISKKFNLKKTQIKNKFDRTKEFDKSLWNVKKDKLQYTNEQKKDISIRRTKWCLNNKEKHVWSISHRISAPCEKLKEKLRKENIIFYEEYMPLNDRLFCIDIAFPQYKIGIEINGNQHYNPDKTLKPYYQERHDLIEKNGWKLFEFYYLWAFENDVIEQIKKILEGNNITYDFKIKEKKVKPIKEDKLKIIFENLIKTDIDFSKFGWVNYAANFTKINCGKINQYMKKYCLSFYEEKCFKRNKNNQFNTCWIIKNNENKKIKIEELNLYLEKGWIKGRKMKNPIFYKDNQ